MTEPPLISIVVPAHNAGRFLNATLKSIAGQTEQRWECVVVDDGSDDGTASIAQRFETADTRFRLVQQANLGASAARNAGFRATTSSTRYVTFMDSDDVWLPNALATLAARAEQVPAAIGSHAIAEFIDEHGEPLLPGVYSRKGRTRLAREGRRLRVLPLDRPTGFDVLINGNVLFPPGLMLVRRTAYELVGPFDVSFSGPEDWDMLIRLSRLGDLEFVDDVLLHYRRHDSNLGAADNNVASQAWRVRCKAFYSPENSPHQRRAARMGWRAYQRWLISDARGRVSECVRHKDPKAVRECARIPVLITRYFRGRPLPRVTSTPLRW